jgi:phage gpG-like protein
MATTFVSGLIFTPELYSINPRTGRPMVSTIDIDIEPTIGILARKVDKLGLDIRSFKEPLKRAVQQVMIPSIRTNFLKHGRPRWQPLTTATVERKGHARPLQDTGALMATMGQLNIWHIDGEKALIPDLPEAVWYGKVHQAGNDSFTRSKGKSTFGEGALIRYDVIDDTFTNVGEEGAIPQRRFIMLQPEDEEAIEEVFDEWLGERSARSGLGTDLESKRGPA